MPNNNSSIQNNTVRFGLLIVLAFVFLYIGKVFQLDEGTVKSYLTNFPVVLSGFIFVVLYVVLTFFIWLGPKDIFRISAAVIFGPYLSTFFVWIAEMINVVILFSLSRKLGRGFVEEKLQSNWQQLDQTISQTSVWWIFLLRLFPIVPLRFLDLGFGLTGVSLKKYLVICMIGTPLRIFVLQFFLSLGADMVSNPQKLSEYLTAHPNIMLLSVGYFIAAIVMMFVLRKQYKN